jgi:gamma-glutamylcyclotransferase (GGCT)/AIG2-like uncharacterized protein YtfP
MAGQFSVGSLVEPLHDQGHQNQGTGQGQQQGGGHRGLSNLSSHYQRRPLLFVYGSLKRGQGAHHLLQGLPWLGQAWLGQAWLPGACLHDLGPFPMAVPGEGRIQGELYGVGEADLAALDRFEGAPRLYQRHWLSLEDGRSAWVYLGRPHQVRHVAPLESGCWLGPSVPAAPRFAALTQTLGLVLLIAGGLQPVWAFDTLGTCQSWQNSRGQARIEVANSIGAAHYLTKMKRLQESDPAAPVPLYSESDIARVCSER